MSQGFLSIGGGLTFITSTNNLGVTNCGSVQANGTYQYFVAGSIYTNLNDTRFTISFSSPTWFLRSNSTSIYQSSSLIGGWSVISGATPVPIVFVGGYVSLTGFTQTTPQSFWGTNNPDGMVIAPKGSMFMVFSNGMPNHAVFNINGLSGWY